ncbi:MAG TPA: M15 family metallopeptidase [Saprospiraceae bacterium]|nr:M15 family metallopeptidase [Saprospiraceae bacterium]MCB9328793.1 M15 family metallopeptidase [Lewinellaceae bacterium]HPK09926.1 M15 family metallopeptidase [Saprospiraceae bacterium]HPQ20355.1 M15 family metallopeptidase [Saprospiraceae bacterium]HRX28860.1 M15 family metallopeptidase [Saprospiraceae bacterium]
MKYIIDKGTDYPKILEVLLIMVLIILATGCKSDNVPTTQKLKKPSTIIKKKPEPLFDYDTTEWTELTEKDGFYLDLKYATTDNFTSQPIYPCGRCFLKKECAKQLIEAQRYIGQKYGLKLVLYDCYRPISAQKKLWDIVPNINYVTPPEKGSMHNRGLGVDLSLMDRQGKLWNMGTEFDYFGAESHIDFKNLDYQILKNRMALTQIMNTFGFKGIKTEWWHYSYRGIHSEIKNWQWECPDEAK